LTEHVIIYKLNDDVFEAFSDRVIELCNHAFSPLYHRVFKRYWNNGIFARMRRLYVSSDIASGYYEFYIPTFEDADYNMKYYRVVIQVVPELDQELLMNLGSWLRAHRSVKPAGIVDSELVCIVAMRRTEEARRKREYIRAIYLKPGHRISPVIKSDPEVCVKRILEMMVTFIKARLKALLKKLRLYRLRSGYCNDDIVYYSMVSNIIDKFSCSLANTVRCFTHVLNWIKSKICHIVAEVRRKSTVRVVMRKIVELRALMREINLSPRYIKSGDDPPILRVVAQALQVDGGIRRGEKGIIRAHEVVSSRGFS